MGKGEMGEGKRKKKGKAVLLYRKAESGMARGGQKQKGKEEGKKEGVIRERRGGEGTQHCSSVYPDRPVLFSSSLSTPLVSCMRKPPVLYVYTEHGFSSPPPPPPAGGEEVKKVTEGEGKWDLEENILYSRDEEEGGGACV